MKHFVLVFLELLHYPHNQEVNIKHLVLVLLEPLHDPLVQAEGDMKCAQNS